MLNVNAFGNILRRNGLSLDTRVTMLPYNGKIGNETRRVFWHLAREGYVLSTKSVLPHTEGKIAKALPVNRIISYGECNVACPYCKRDCQFVDGEGRTIGTKTISITELAELCLKAISNGETPRFSGGDPVSFKRETQVICEYLYEEHGAKSSIAHNGTWGASIAKLAPYLDTAAIDLKGTPDKIGVIMGVKQSAGAALYIQSLKTQKTLTEAGVLIDVRTPIFGTTTPEDMAHLAEDILSNSSSEKVFWTWRLYKPILGLTWEKPALDKTLEMMKLVSEAYPKLWMGVRAKWQDGGMLYCRGGMFLNGKDADDNEEIGSGNGDLK